MLCKLCKGSLTKIYQVKDFVNNAKFNVLLCSGCKTACPSPQPDKASLNKYYINYRKPDGTRFNKIIEGWISFCYLLRVQKLLRFKKSGSVLDIGCGRGVELLMLKKRGWKVLGTEFTKELVQFLTGKGIPVRQRPIWDVKGKFDTVMFWHSLEHVYNPLRQVHEARRLLKKRGILIIATPDFGSVERKIFGRNWFHLDMPRHLFLFSKENFLKVVEDVGFSCISYSTFAPEYDFYAFLQGCLNIIFPRYPNLLYKTLMTGIFGRRLRGMVILQLILMPFFLIISSFAVALFALFKQGGTMILVFKKE